MSDDGVDISDDESQVAYTAVCIKSCDDSVSDGALPGRRGDCSQRQFSY